MHENTSSYMFQSDTRPDGSSLILGMKEGSQSKGKGGGCLREKVGVKAEFNLTLPKITPNINSFLLCKFLLWNYGIVSASFPFHLSSCAISGAEVTDDVYFNATGTKFMQHNNTILFVFQDVALSNWRSVYLL